MAVTLGQQYNIGEKPTVILCTSINRHARTPSKTKTKDTMSSLDTAQSCYDVCQHYHYVTILLAIEEVTTTITDWQGGGQGLVSDNYQVDLLWVLV